MLLEALLAVPQTGKPQQNLLAGDNQAAAYCREF
jgi:hypothetical protein